MIVVSTPPMKKTGRCSPGTSILHITIAARHPIKSRNNGRIQSPPGVPLANTLL